MDGVLVKISIAEINLSENNLIPLLGVGTGREGDLMVINDQ